MRFSQRIGRSPVKVDIQLESMDKDLKVSLWNAFDLTVIETLTPDRQKILYQFIWANLFKLPVEELPVNYKAKDRLRISFLNNWSWYEVYDFIEFIAQTLPVINEDPGPYIAYSNEMMTRELSAYRFVNGEISAITDKHEIEEIEGAISAPNNLAGVRVHLTAALKMLSDRKEPDYRNSIKESISAVESIAQVISGDPKATLGSALKLIDDKIGIHKALKSGLSSIYGYTSDEAGIRHAILEEREIHFEDAKFMLVSCSAFINYLIMKSDRAGIKLRL